MGVLVRCLYKAGAETRRYRGAVVEKERADVVIGPYKCGEIIVMRRKTQYAVR